MIHVERPDIVITDIRMPGMDGLELIQKCFESGHKIRFIVLSGYREFSYAQRALKYQVEDYLLKPVNEQELNTLLCKLTSQIEAAQEHIRLEHKRNTQYSMQMEQIRQNALLRICTEKNYIPDASIIGTHPAWMFFALRADCVSRPDMDQASARSILENVSAHVYTLIRSWIKLWNVVYFPHTSYILVQCNPDKRPDILCALQPFAQEDFIKYPHLHLFLAVGLPVLHPGQLRQGFEHVRQLLSMRICENTSVILDGQYISPVSDGLSIEVKNAIADTASMLFETDQNRLIGRLESEFQKFCSQPKYFFHVYEWADYFLKQLRRVAEQQEVRLDENMNTIIDDALEWSMHCESRMQLLSCMTQAVQDLYEKKQRRELEPILAAKKYVEKHLDRQVTLQEVAEQLHFSPSYFSSYFKDKNGIGFAEFAMQARVKQAMLLLRTQDCTMAEIADKVGYADVKHFSRVFKKITGIKPGEYRKFYS